MSNPIKNRYDFVYLYDVKDGNPNGDPDQANLPRADAENQEGIVTDVCIKRKVRNYVSLKHELKSPHDIFIRQDTILNKIIDSAKGEKPQDRQKELCKAYYDIRTFGAVLSTGDKGAGTVRGPVQFTFSRSEDRIYQAEHSITRCAVTTEKEAQAQEKREHASTFGRKSTVPYALYRMHGFISAVDAAKTGFSEEDLNLLWESLLNAFEHDRAAARGEMNPRKLVIFKHSNHLGSARSGELFEKVVIESKTNLPRDFKDYNISIDEKVPAGIELIIKL
ncbi:MAG TPA: type I-C CRISPR-associated protein Cas7/Csd2 [Spirochaetota bacterium]|nr:type I-C CRISPR-associated protein Cas7/Csd2 [Spirochaetota bacterium]HPF07450.1 type I-C CRISPR-associated protein Cas7/Csd2 [Spirochaetota bacterium]HPJ43545.1 type I-C CRISPR-associated protein Cas7/Csd2 [Spirochaetota bacterium]HRX48932.1 type I-C CRISPR-associated protein Cas7/Csd2 [Spirochaetota bacterium]